MTPPRLTPDQLVDRYDAFLLDAYGVLVRSDGALPGAVRFLDRLARAGKPFLILSNDASRSIETTWQRYRRFGLPLAREQIVTSGLLLADHYRQEGLAGAPTIVLGTEDACDYVVRAGGRVVAADDERAEVLVVADDDGYPFLETVNAVITVLFRRLEAGRETRLLLPNPDLVFPMADRAFGFTAGAIAVMLEAILRLRDPAGRMRFVPLGKPHAPLFTAGLARLPGVDRRKVVMIGDQLVTDIRGANGVGLDSVFVETGVGRLADADGPDALPTWVMAEVG